MTLSFLIRLPNRTQGEFEKYYFCHLVFLCPNFFEEPMFLTSISLALHRHRLVRLSVLQLIVSIAGLFGMSAALCFYSRSIFPGWAHEDKVDSSLLCTRPLQWHFIYSVFLAVLGLFNELMLQ